MRHKKGYMPYEQEHNRRCNFIDCGAGLGLVGSGNCFLNGEWWKKDCKYFIADKEFEPTLKNRIKWFFKKRRNAKSTT